MSATMDQHIFNESSATNTKKKHQRVLTSAKTNAKKIIGADMNKPTAQINGSHLWLRARNRWAKYDPSGTPMSPDVIATMPKLSEMLNKFRRV